MILGKRCLVFDCDIFLFLLLIFAFIFAFVTPAWAQTEESDSGRRVVEIVIRGDVNVQEKRIRGEINFSSGDKVTTEEIKKNVERIENTGLFQEVSVETVSRDEGIAVRYNVVENPLVSDIVFEGNELLNSEKLKKVLNEAGVKVGEVLNNDELNKGVKKLTEKYKEEGYPLVTVGNVDVSQGLRITIVEGRLKQMNVKGLVSVPKKVAFGMIEVPKGKPIKMRDLQLSYRDLERSVYFKEVNLIPRRGYESSDIILEWNLKERMVLEQPKRFKEIDLVGGSAFSDSMLEDMVGELPQGEKTNYQVLKALSDVYRRYLESGFTKLDFESAGLESDTLKVALKEGVVKEIELKGNTRTSDSVILSRMVIKKGRPFNVKDRKSSRRKLLDLGYFSDVSIESSRVEEGIKVSVDIKEKSRLSSIRGSASWSGGNIVGSVTLSQKNLFGWGQDVSLDFKRGFSKDSGLDLSMGWKNYAFPYEFDSTNFKLYRNVDRSGDSTTTKTGFDISLSYPLSRNLSLSMGFNHEYVDKSEGSDYNANILSTGLTHDNRDNPLFPTFGGKRSLQVRKAGNFAPGIEFNILDLSISQYFSLPQIGDNKQTIAFRFLSSLSFDTPKSRRPRIGGSSMLRGFGATRVKNLALLNSEYRAQILPKTLYLTAFADTGLGFDLTGGMTTGISTSLGLEANLRMFGHLRLGAAWPLKEDFSWFPEFYFSMGPIF